MSASQKNAIEGIIKKYEESQQKEVECSPLLRKIDTSLIAPSPFEELTEDLFAKNVFLMYQQGSFRKKVIIAAAITQLICFFAAVSQYRMKIENVHPDIPQRIYLWEGR